MELGQFEWLEEKVSPAGKPIGTDNWSVQKITLIVYLLLLTCNSGNPQLKALINEGLEYLQQII